MQIVTWSDIAETERHAGHYRRQAEFDTCYIAIHRYLSRGEGYDIHSHPETQAGYVLNGAMAMVFPEGPSVLSAGHAYVVPTSVEHGGKGSGDAEATVLNLYVKRHLVRPTDEAVWRGDWSGGAPKQVRASGVELRLEELPGGARRSLDPQGAQDVFDVLLKGDVEVIEGGSRSTLQPADVVQWRGAHDDGIVVGPGGATFLRFVLL